MMVIHWLRPVRWDTQLDAVNLHRCLTIVQLELIKGGKDHEWRQKLLSIMFKATDICVPVVRQHYWLDTMSVQCERLTF